MTINEHISKTLKETYESGSFKMKYPRHKSWEYCHKVFLNMHNKKTDLTDDDYDYLALNLAFYLASYGMYRGSCPILQHNYKIHIEVVKKIMESKYDTLWDYEPSDSNIEEASNLLFGSGDQVGIYQRIKKFYSDIFSGDSNYLSKNEEEIVDKPTDTLITKILLGTFACIPAFDTFFNKACKEREISTKPDKAFKGLCDFVIKYYRELQFKCSDDIYYPPMKALDLYFWRVGYGLSLV